MSIIMNRLNGLLPGFVFSTAIVSTALFTVAACAYPGGNHFDHHAIGHDFWRNALCDVARSTAVGGAPNALGSAFARASMTTLAIGIGALFWLLAERFKTNARLAIGVRVLASITVPAAVAVVFLPTDRFSDLHGIAVVIAGILGLAAAVATISGLVGARRTPERFVAALGIATLLAAAGALAIYVDELVRGGPARLAVPVLEHVAALSLLLWMVVVSITASLRATRPRARATRCMEP